MEDTRAEQEQIRITETEDAERQVLLHPEDNDLFVRTGAQVINACRLDISVELWMEEFRGMLAEVGRWAKDRAGRVRSCYCSPRGARLVVFFCPTGDGFDFELADDLADLNINLRQTFNLGMVEVQQIPWDESARFLHPETARWVYGQRFDRTSPAVEA